MISAFPKDIKNIKKINIHIHLLKKKRNLLYIKTKAILSTY
jgi:hypothetical protein